MFVRCKFFGKNTGVSKYEAHTSVFTETCNTESIHISRVNPCARAFTAPLGVPQSAIARASSQMSEGATTLLTARLTPGVRYHIARGDSLVESGGPSYHTLRYAFKPDSVSHATNGSIQLGTSGAVKMHVQTGGARVVSFEGNVEPHKLTEFVLLRDSDGSLRLERLSQNVKNLKVVRDAPKATAPELTPEAVAQLKARAARGARATQAPRVTPAKRAAPVAVEAAPKQSCDDDDVDAAQLFGGDEDEVAG